MGSTILASIFAPTSLWPSKIDDFQSNFPFQSVWLWWNTKISALNHFWMEESRTKNCRSINSPTKSLKGVHNDWCRQLIKQKMMKKNFSIQKFIHTISVWNNSKAANLEFWNLLKGGYSIEKRRKTWDSHSRKWKEIFSHREPADMRDWKTRNYQKRNEEIFLLFSSSIQHTTRDYENTQKGIKFSF